MELEIGVQERGRILAGDRMRREMRMKLPTCNDVETRMARRGVRLAALSLLLLATPASAQAGGAAGSARRTAKAAAERAAFTRKLVAAAVDRAKVRVRYVADYVRIPYPGGDVPAGTGVCTDEIIRIYRKVGVDLQKEVHEDMARDFAAYPRRLSRPDPNIDHRRVPNIMAFFARRGEALPITGDPADYLPGDVVAWDLQAGHVGMVVEQRDPSGQRRLIFHNVGQGPRIEDALFEWKVIGHYRYYGPA